MRRVLAAIAGALLLWSMCVLAPSATAHDGHANWFKWREPEDNSDVSGQNVVLRAKVAFEEGVSRWAVEILPPDGYATVPGWGIVCESKDKEKRSATVEISCEWNTTTYPDGKPSRNHAYRARVNAWNEEGSSASKEQPPQSSNEQPPAGSKGQPPEGGSGSAGGGGSGGGSTGDETSTSSTSTSTSTTTSTSTSTTTTTTTTQGSAAAGEKHQSPFRTLVVANPPAAPEGVALAYEKKASQVTVSWDPNSEPDIAHYVVEERFDSGEWSLVAKTKDTSWKGRLDEKGTYRFRVAAARYVGSPERIKEGPRREPQSGMRRVEADPGRDTTESNEPETAPATGRRQDQAEENKKKKKGENPKEPETTTSSTAPPESVIVNYGGGADPASTSTTGAPEGQPAPSGLSAIEPGSPGSVQTRYADPPRLPAPVPPEQAYDPGFSLALPYPKEVRLDIGPPPEPPPRLLGTVVLFDSNEEQRRALVGVLAGGLVVFIISMQAAYLNRRPRPIDLAASADWD